MCLIMYICEFFFCKQKTAYEMRISDWSSDVCSSDLGPSRPAGGGARVAVAAARRGPRARGQAEEHAPLHQQADGREHRALRASRLRLREGNRKRPGHGRRAYGAGTCAVTARRALVAVEPADLAGEVRALVGAAAAMDDALLNAAIRGWSHNTDRKSTRLNYSH